MASDDTLRFAETEALRQENDQLRLQFEGYQRALYTVLWQSVSPPTAEELASAEPVGPWFDELVQRLEEPAGK